MAISMLPKPHFLTRTKPCPDGKPECVEPFHLQEEFTGPLPVWSGRPAAELLAERLAESDPASPSPVFIP
jgi:hypothetical protein